ncbi:MAG: S8 family serine peptidase, partial [Acidobacteriota bacterium]
MRFARLAPLLVCVCCFSSFGLDRPVRPVLSVEREGSMGQLWVETTDGQGVTHRRLLRETPARLEPVATGWGLVGDVAFATWKEDADQAWFSYSRDAGASWQAAKPLATDLRLRAGTVRADQTMPAPRAGLSLPAAGRVFLVQFRTVGLTEWRESLARLGVEVLQHIPHNAHLVRCEPAVLPDMATLDFVGRVEPYHPSYRLAEDVLSWIETADDEPRRVRAMAFERGDVGKKRIAAAALDLGAEIAAFSPSGHIIELWVTREQIRALAAHDDVLWIDFWTPAETDMDLVREDAGTNWLENDSGSCGQGVRGEVMDQGIEETHQDFDGVLLSTEANVDSHGTSTYGIVFGNGARDGDGNAQATGHMPCAEQGIFADFNNVSDRFAHTQKITQAPYFASFQTNSWGDSRTRSYTSVSHQMDDIIFRLDIAITQSQSNAGNQDSRPQAWAKNIISVGGVYHRNTLDTADDEWDFGASIGPAEDGRIKPDLHYWYDSIYTTTTGNGYTSGFGGTSAATPETAGILGLILQMWADNVWETDPIGDTVFEKKPHVSTLKALLINNAQQYDFSGQSHDL